MSILPISWACFIAVVFILVVPNSAVANGRSAQPIITLKLKQEKYWKNLPSKKIDNVFADQFNAEPPLKASGPRHIWFLTAYWRERSVQKLQGQTVDFDAYRADSQRRIKKCWSPQQVNQSANTLMEFQIKQTGEVTNIKVIQPSGLEMFDCSAIEAIKLASPLRPLPAGVNSPGHMRIAFKCRFFPDSRTFTQRRLPHRSQFEHKSGSFPKTVESTGSAPYAAAIAKAEKSRKYPGEQAQALHDLGYSHMSKGAYTLAEPLLKQALGLTEKYIGASTDTFCPCDRTWQVVDDYFLVDYLHTLATNYYLWGNFDLAEPYYRRLMKIMETYKLPGKDLRCTKIHDFRLAGDIRRYASILRSHNLNKEAEEVEAFASKFEQQQKDGLTPL